MCSTEMRHFFSVYKELGGQATAVNEARAAAAAAVVQQAIARYVELSAGDNRGGPWLG
jgi:hypothetical protein